MKQLSDLCLQCVGANLHSITRVRTFLPTIYKEILLERLAWQEKLTPKYVPHVTYNLFAETLKTVNLYKCSQLTDYILGQLNSSGCQLKHLTIHLCVNITDVGIQNITRGQEELECLELRKLVKLTGKGLVLLNSPVLHTLDLRECTALTSDAISETLKRNPSVKTLKLVRCEHLDSDVYPAIARTLNNTLEMLDVDGLHFTTDAALDVLAQHCPNLKGINLHGCDKITPTGLNQLMSGCTSLKLLDLSYCKSLEGNNSRCLVDLPVSITELSLCGVMISDEEILVSAMSRLTRLKSIKFCGVPAITDNSLTEILRSVGDGLEKLDMSGGIMSPLTDHGLRAVSKYCNNLEFLALSLLKHITGVTLLPLIEDPERADNFTTVLFNFRQMEMDVMHQVASRCHHLVRVNVSGLLGVDDSLLLTLAANCPSLNHLNVKGCKQVTDIGVCEVARYCPLTIAVLSGLGKLTDSSVFCLAHNCPYLQELYISGCSLITKSAVHYLQDQCIPRVYYDHKVPNADGQLMAKNLDTGEFCRADNM